MAYSAPPPSSSPPLHLSTSSLPSPTLPIPSPIYPKSHYLTTVLIQGTFSYLTDATLLPTKSRIRSSFEYLRLAQLYSSVMSPGGKVQNALAPVDHSEPKKKKARGNGLVRVSDLSPADQIQNRNSTPQPLSRPPPAQSLNRPPPAQLLSRPFARSASQPPSADSLLDFNLTGTDSKSRAGLRASSWLELSPSRVRAGFSARKCFLRRAELELPSFCLSSARI